MNRFSDYYYCLSLELLREDFVTGRTCLHATHKVSLAKA